MTSHKAFSVLVSIMAITFVLSGLAGPICQAADPIKIGASLSLTGKYAWTGERMYEGYTCWEKLINEKGYSPGMKQYGHSEPGLITRLLVVGADVGKCFR